jgi:glycosyltransferase involved in cell wall biosynthesis
MKILIKHYEYYPNYLNKNVGYFIKSALNKRFSVVFETKTIHQKNRRHLPSGFTVTTKKQPLKQFKYAWVYPFEPHLIPFLIKLRLNGVKPIIKMDSVIFSRLRALVVAKLAHRVIVESQAVAKPFNNHSKLRFYSGGLSQENLNLIATLKPQVKRQKIILYAGRKVRQKGFDRLAKIKPPGWKLKTVSNLTGELYYKAVLQSSLVILPTRGEGFPNVFSDAYFCRRLFLPTQAAACGEAINDPIFFVKNDLSSLRHAVRTVTNQIDYYYRRFNKLYHADQFVVADDFFSSLLQA